MISPQAADNNGLLTHTVNSAFQGGETKIHLLLPDGFDRNDSSRVLYVLPVEPHDGDQCGDAMKVIREHDLHNQHQLVCVLPTFSHAPWYADHPRNLHLRQESYLLKVVIPFVDDMYCAGSTDSMRLLVGFSKSGWGAFSLLLRNPDLFSKAAAFDAPFGWETPNRYGMGEVFGTQDNMDEYCIGALLEPSVERLGAESRLALYGFSDFRGHHQFLHYRMLHFGIPHEYEDGPLRDHRWDSGWLPTAVAWLDRGA